MGTTVTDVSLLIATDHIYSHNNESNINKIVNIWYINNLFSNHNCSYA